MPALRTSLLVAAGATVSRHQGDIALRSRDERTRFKLFFSDVGDTADAGPIVSLREFSA